MIQEATPLYPCARCKGHFDRFHFRPDPRMRRGLKSYCLDCERIYSTEYRRANAGHVNDLRNERRRQNPEKTRANRKRYYQMYKDKEREQQRQWVRANRARFNAMCRRHTAKKRDALPIREASEVFGVPAAKFYYALSTGALTRITFRGSQLTFVSRKEVQSWAQGKRSPSFKRAKNLDSPLGFNANSGSFYEVTADPNATDPLQRVIEEQCVEVLLEWVADVLNPREREVLMEYAEANFDASAVSEALCIPVPQVRSIIRSIQKRATKDFFQKTGDNIGV